MSKEITILNVLCEGQTEERFAKEVLKPYFKDKGIIIKHRLLLTSKKKNARGGMLNYCQAKNDLITWMKQNDKKNSEQHFYTTMFDLYALPDDFPDWKEAIGKSDKHLQVQTIEEAFSKDINHSNFIPYIQLHEFEALVFGGLDKLLDDYPGCHKEIEGLKKILESYDNDPEAINNSPQTAPSKRIIQALKGKYNYNKPQSGTTVTKATGIDNLRTQCRHFNEWLVKIENLI